ncbi:MAG TPA: HNH endonuclease [Anaeromyxobacter sp.]|nr:HNH endonuclease [Anaeromyxobacter sp.]
MGAVRGGEKEADDCERWLATASRARAALDLAIAEGLAALRMGDLLAELSYHLHDYAREVLGIEGRTALDLVRLANELRVRPLLREAVRSGRVRFRAAQVVLPVAVGDAEADWVERAATETVRGLEKLVAEAPGGKEPEEEWGRICIRCKPEEREVVDAALDVAGQLLPGSRRFERLAAMAEEYLGEFPTAAEEAEDAPARLAKTELRSFFRLPRRAQELDARKAQLEAETDRWAVLERVADVAAPELSFDGLTSASDIDARLRDLARLQNGWDEILGYCAHILKKSRIHELLGFAGFHQYCEERLGLPARTVEQRAALEERMWESPALREARRQKLSYEKLRVLARLPEKQIASSIQRARTMTCVALRHEVEAAEERQMRARHRLVAPEPKRVALLLAAAIRSVRAQVGMPIADGTCLAVVAAHFLRVWGMPEKPRSSSQRVRARDEGRCTVPGCSRAASHSHHVLYLSRGGHRTALSNQTAVCAFHHQRCIHPGYLRVFGRAPDRLKWLRGGKLWTGVPEEG